MKIPMLKIHACCDISNLVPLQMALPIYQVLGLVCASRIALTSHTAWSCTYLWSDMDSSHAVIFCLHTTHEKLALPRNKKCIPNDVLSTPDFVLSILLVKFTLLQYHAPTRTLKAFPFPHYPACIDMTQNIGRRIHTFLTRQRPPNLIDFLIPTRVPLWAAANIARESTNAICLNWLTQVMRDGHVIRLWDRMARVIRLNEQSWKNSRELQKVNSEVICIILSQFADAIPHTTGHPWFPQSDQKTAQENGSVTKHSWLWSFRYLRKYTSEQFNSDDKRSFWERTWSGSTVKIKSHCSGGICDSEMLKWKAD